MTAHRDTRIAWRTLQARIKAAAGSSCVLWRHIVRDFYTDGMNRAERKVVDDEAELALEHLMKSGRAVRSIGITDKGSGLVVQLTGVDSGTSTPDTNTQGD